jgi:TolB-like protein/Tfp pilus assembly protein PilF
VLDDLGTAQSAVASGAEKPSPSIAVLPFVDMSSAKDQEYFCDGIAEELINALSQIEDLKVIARTSAFSFRGKEVDVRDIGRKLNVGTVLEGSVRKAGNRVRITAQLVDTIGGHHLWSEKFDREMEDIFAIQDEISEDIVGKLKPRLFEQMKPKPEKRKVVDVESYSLYLKARYFWNKSTPEDMAKAIEYYRQAIEKNMNYAIAYAGLADSYSAAAYYGSVRPKDAFPMAREAALKALALDETLVEAQAALAFINTVHDWNWDGAERGFKKAIKLNPGYAFSHLWYAYYLMYVARFEEAMEETRKGLELDPLSLVMNMGAWEVSFISRNYDRATKILDNISDIDPFGTFVHLLRALTYTQKELHEEAIAELEKEKKVSGTVHSISEVWSGVIYARAGRNDDARKTLESLLELSKQSYVPPFFFAILYFYLKEDDSALEWLEKAFEERDQWLCYLKILPHIEIIDMVPDSRYRALIRRIGLDK